MAVAASCSGCVACQHGIHGKMDGANAGRNVLKAAKVLKTGEEVHTPAEQQPIIVQPELQQ